MKPKIIMLILIAVFFCGCNGKSAVGIKDSQLGKSLKGAECDYVYCAITYLIRNNAPPLSRGPHNTLKDWHKEGTRYSKWLEKQSPEEQARIINGYMEFVKIWSPCFLPKKKCK